jgi:hypothetical protein
MKLYGSEVKGVGGQSVPHLSAGYNLSTTYFLTIDRFH